VVSLAPDVAEAHALLGEAYLREALFNPLARAASWQKADASVRRALAIDGDNASAHAVLSRILLFRDWNWTNAAAEARRAIELDPDAADVRSAYAGYLRAAGRSAEAIVERERARRADLLNPQRLIALGDEYTFARRYADAIETYQRALEIERDHRAAVASLADVYPRIDRFAEGAFWRSRMLTLAGQTELAATFDDVRRRQGPKEALQWLDRQNVAEFERAPEDHLWALAYLHARLGHTDAALAFLQRACDRRDSGVLQARVDPDLDSIRGDRRFQDLLKRIGPP
jgi:tetratricopeptide (TPR) repeat protein